MFDIKEMCTEVICVVLSSLLYREGKKKYSTDVHKYHKTHSVNSSFIADFSFYSLSHLSYKIIKSLCVFIIKERIFWWSKDETHTARFDDFPVCDICAAIVNFKF